MREFVSHTSSPTMDSIPGVISSVSEPDASRMESFPIPSCSPSTRSVSLTKRFRTPGTTVSD